MEGIRTRPRPGNAFVPLAAAVLLAGCGGAAGPHLTRDDAASLIRLADRIPTEGACAQARDIRALAARRTALVKAHRVPPALAESLSAGVNALVEQTPPCLPPAPPAAEETTPPATVVVPEHGHKHGKHDNHGKHGKHHGDEGGD